MSGERKTPSLAAELGRYMGAGLTWTLSTLLFLWVGWRVDAWLGSRPVATLVGAFVGAGAGLYWMLKQLQPADATGGEDREESREE